MFHHIAHMAYHFVGGGCGLRFVLDLYLFQKKAEFDKKALNELLKIAGLNIFYDTVCELTEYWFGKDESVSELVYETEKHILLGGIYGTKKQGGIDLPAF